MLGAGGVSRQISEIDLSLVGGGKLNLGLLSSLSDSLEGEFVVVDVHAVLVLEFLHEELLKHEVEIFSSEGSISIGGLNLEHSTRDLENRDIKGSTTEIVHGDNLSVSLVETESKSSSGGLVDDSLDLKVSNFTSILGGLSLGIVEISRHGNDGLLAGMSKIRLSGFLHFHQNEGSNLLRRVLLTSGFNPGISISSSNNFVGEVLEIFLGGLVIEASSNESFTGENCVFGISDGLSLGRDTNEALVVVGESDGGGRGPLTLRIFNNLSIVSLHDGDAGVGGAQINSDNPKNS